jgi:[acyl-carrier-protein] S-malonyltransferase
MLLPWLDLPGTRDRVDAWSSATGLDLLALGTRGTEQDIRDTAVAQPLLTAAALLSAGALLDGTVPDAVCGHSVGELAALAVAGVLSDDQAVVLAAERGAAMAAAAAQRSTGMAAVLGGRPEEVAAAADRLGLTLATVNVDGQVVLGGPTQALKALAHEPPARARVRLLDVAGAFHTAAMEPAVARMRGLVEALSPADPRCVVVANADGAAVDDGRALLDRLVAQLTCPVRFDLCLRTLTGGATGVVELAPGGTLAGLARRALPAVPVVALSSPDDLPTARALLAETAGAPA